MTDSWTISPVLCLWNSKPFSRVVTNKEKIFLLAVILYHRQTGRWLFTLTPAALSYISIAGPESRLVFLPQLLQVHLL